MKKKTSRLTKTSSVGLEVKHAKAHMREDFVKLKLQWRFAISRVIMHFCSALREFKKNCLKFGYTVIHQPRSCFNLPMNVLNIDE